MRSRSKKTPAKSPVYACLSLMPVDSAQVRKQFTRDYEKAMRDMEAVRSQLRQFEERDKPQFLRWMHREFGANLTEIREVSHKLRTQEEILFRVQNITLFEGVSPKKAYEYVMHEQERAERERQETQEEQRKREEQGQRKEEKESFWSHAEEDFFPKDEDEMPSAGLGKPGKVEQERLARLKEIYRMVVRKLHPDTQKEMTPHKLDLWHQAQAAYSQEDSDQLEVILAMCEIEEQASTRQTRISVLQRITAAFKRSLKPLRAELKKSQKDPAWNFSGKQGTEVKELGRRMQSELNREITILREELADIEAELTQIKSSRRRKSRVVVDPFDVFFGNF